MPACPASPPSAHSPIFCRCGIEITNEAGVLRGAQARMGSMGLDVNTLFLVTIYVEAMLGLLLLFAWIQNSGIRAVAWWGCGHLLCAASIVMFGMYGSVPDMISIDLANALLFVAFAVMWCGARVFDGRPP